MVKLTSGIYKSGNTTKSLSTVHYSQQGLLASLPSPLSKSSGWPWTEQTKPLAPTMENGKPWPKISIVTPSYNQGKFIEETIRSVLLQNYPNLEYVIIDGGSTDETQAILELYSSWLSYVISEPDGGQSNAINKGLAKASGDWINWLNSDDFLLPNALNLLVAQVTRYTGFPNAIIFACQIISEESKSVKEVWHPRVPKNLISFFDSTDYPVIPQPSTFIRADRIKVLEKYHYVMDWVLYLQLEDRFPGTFREVDITIAAFREQEKSKTLTSSSKFTDEAISFLEENIFETPNISKKIQKKISKLKLGQKIVNLPWHNKKSCLLELIKIAVISPNVIFDRMFIGATKKVLLSTCDMFMSDPE